MGQLVMGKYKFTFYQVLEYYINHLFDKWGMPSEKDVEWLKRHLSQLMDDGLECEGACHGIGNSFGYHTPIKLCVMKNYVDIYTRILDKDRLKRLGFNGCAYFDVFAGSGINYIGDNKTAIIGSMPIAAKYSFRERKFNHYYGIELDPDYCRALKERMSRYASPDQVTIYEGRAEEKIGEVIDDIEKKRYHYMAFVDYEDVKGLSWDSLERLLKKKGDVWITVLHNVSRTIGRSEWSKADRETLERTFSKEVIESSSNFEELQDNYIQKIRRSGKAHANDIRISSGDGYSYQLIFATRETQGGSGYTTGVDNLKQRAEALSGIYVKQTMEILKNVQKTLF